ncbi:hypothetical protein MSAR_39510 [Mycolicibacterium sarraceniae]|uniref:Uncharacterized protein n=1 Tax=Mycolicibacterium sarraceniae TaxID=1534348 RepID=A0A7I7SXS9_9MYCO|nr:hypothetical protein MSAR_39510 [Mycolicibacterium sarraceniae]
MTTLDEAVARAEADRGLAVVSTLRADNTIQASLINAGLAGRPGPAAAAAAQGVHRLRWHP